MKKRTLIFAGLMTFTSALVWYTPTAVVAPKLKQAVKGLTFSSGEGTIWQGSLNQVVFRKVRLGKVSWALKPASLLKAKLSTHLAISDPEFTFQGLLSVTPDQKLHLDESDFMVNAHWLEQIKAISRFTRLSGEFNGQVSHLEWPIGSQQPPSLTGRVNWLEGGVLSPIKLNPGNYAADVKPDKEGFLQALLSSHEAPVDVSGQVTLNNNWQYATDITLKPQADQKMIKQMLSYVARPNPQGQFAINKMGKLFQ